MENFFSENVRMISPTHSPHIQTYALRKAWLTHKSHLRVCVYPHRLIRCKWLISTNFFLQYWQASTTTLSESTNSVCAFQFDSFVSCLCLVCV
jgi:hypothetical protein